MRWQEENPRLEAAEAFARAADNFEPDAFMMTMSAAITGQRYPQYFLFLYETGNRLCTTYNAY